MNADEHVARSTPLSLCGSIAHRTPPNTHTSYVHAVVHTSQHAVTSGGEGECRQKTMASLCASFSGCSLRAPSRVAMRAPARAVAARAPLRGGCPPPQSRTRHPRTPSRA